MLGLLLPDAAHAAEAGVTLLVAALLAGLGALAGARRPAVALVAGWGFSDFFLVLWATLLHLPLTGGLAVLGVGGFAGLAWSGWTRMKIGPGDPPLWPSPARGEGMFVRVLLLAAPLLLIASAISPVGFDEYSHWLPNLGYLVLHDHLPTLAEPNTVSVRPGYPPGLAFVGLAVSRIVGHRAEGAGIVWSTLLAVALGGLCAELVARCWRGRAMPWGAAGLGLAAATLLSPSFDPHRVFSNYGDAPAGYATAIMAVGLMFWLDDAGPDAARQWRPLWPLGLCGAALVSIRQDSLAVFALVWVGALAAGLAERRRVRLLPLLALLPAPLLAAAMWRVYQTSEIPGGAAAMLPPEKWHWQQLGDMLASMVHVMLRHWAHFFLVLLLAAVAVAALAAPNRFTPLQRAASVLGAVIGLGKIASLALLYLGADFNAGQAAAATEFWRFSLHAGPTVTAAALTLLPYGRLRPAWGWFWRAAPWLAVALPVAYAGRLRIDLPHGAPAPELRLRAMARDIATLTAGASPITLVDTTDADAMELPHVIAVRYELLLGLRPALAVPVPRVRLLDGDPPREVVVDGGLPHFARAGADGAGDARAAKFVWFYDGGATASRLAGLDLQAGASYLVAHDADGARIVRSWAR